VRYSKKEEVKRWKNVIQRLKKQIVNHLCWDHRYGLCHAIRLANIQLKYDSIYKPMINRLKPFEPIHDGAYWFPKTNAGDRQRIAIVQTIIRNLSPRVRKTT
jgi:hypothetical protein